MEGRKEGGGGGRAEPRQLEFLRRKDRAEKRVPSLGVPRDGRRRALTRFGPLVFPDVDGGSSPLSLSSSLAPARKGRSRSPAWLPPVELQVRERREEEEEEEEVVVEGEEGTSEGVRKRKGRKERTSAKCRLTRVGRGRRNS